MPRGDDVWVKLNVYDVTNDKITDADRMGSAVFSLTEILEQSPGEPLSRK